MERIVIPYKPRFPQDEIHRLLQSCRFCVLAAHRRMGKTVLAVNHLIRQAVLCPNPRPVFAYVAPLRNQAERVAWPYVRHFAAAIPGTAFHEQKLCATFANGAQIRIFGADNPDALRGMYLDGAVLDEVAQMRRETWEEVIRPCLADRNGSALFIGTPHGVDLFSELFFHAQKQGGEWLALRYRADETGILPESELESLRLGMAPAAFAREFMCDFGAADSDTLIPSETVRLAMERHLAMGANDAAPLVLGVDVARFGGDASVITLRRGLVCEPQRVFRKLSTMELANAVAKICGDRMPDAVFVDGVGIGAGVVDRLREFGVQVCDAQSSAKASAERFANKRAEMWVNMREWLEHGAIPNDAELAAELSAASFAYGDSGALMLAPKDEMRQKLRRSPDKADSLALTFYAPVFRRRGLAGQVRNKYAMF